MNARHRPAPWLNINRGSGWLQNPLWGPTAAWQSASVRKLEVGSQVGFWTIVEAPPPPRGNAKWKCQCMCGTEREVKGVNLLSGASRSCGCPKFSWLAFDPKKKIRDAWIEKRRAAGICKCGGLLSEGQEIRDSQDRCQRCTYKDTQQNKKRRNTRLANGECPYCGGSPAPNKKHCQECLYKQTASTFNISVEEAVRLRNSPCEVCGENGSTVLDHDHATGAVRGPLCNNCNAALGFAKENPEILQRLISYICRHRPSKQDETADLSLEGEI